MLDETEKLQRALSGLCWGRKAAWPHHFIGKVSHMLFIFNIIFMWKTDWPTMVIQTGVLDRHFVKKMRKVNLLQMGKQLTAFVAHDAIQAFMRKPKFGKNDANLGSSTVSQYLRLFLVRSLVMRTHLRSFVLANKIWQLIQDRYNFSKPIVSKWPLHGVAKLHTGRASFKNISEIHGC